MVIWRTDVTIYIFIVCSNVKYTSGKAASSQNHPCAVPEGSLKPSILKRNCSRGSAFRTRSAVLPHTQHIICNKHVIHTGTDIFNYIQRNPEMSNGVRQTHPNPRKCCLKMFRFGASVARAGYPMTHWLW